MRLPFRPEELKSPRKAASRLGEQNAIQLYLTEMEPAFRDDPEPFPKDWAWRKFVLYTRDNGLCEECHKPARFDEVNAHHKDPAKGHRLDNLELLHEWPCHRKVRHPVEKKAA
ncbi:MAG TPA: hypothetical protein VJP04_11980 [Terriglobales bacterium]|jgi:hypothetical protein|nr:hypothetical protein [Terriglobales bacterium]